MIEFQKNLPSVRKAQRLKDLKEKFDGICNESEIEIHKRLEELLKYIFCLIFLNDKICSFQNYILK